MNKIQIENCLKVEFQLPQESAGTRKIYLLPYVGNMTKGKIDLLARNLKTQLVKDGWQDSGETMVEAVCKRLESPWFTGKEKRVTVELSNSGNVDIKGQGWMCANYPPHQVQVLATL